uniref:PlxyGVORF75 protein n=1 Tax=Plutella xylostella granulovirus TaxID=98383 RepID=A0A1B2CSJ1_9BBAC|nr:PlxyGVORF75 protein [Plutella xylostella granulovirus]
MDRVLNLYTFRPKCLCDDLNNSRDEFLIQGVIESIKEKDNYACFLELKKEQLFLLKKLANNLLNDAAGNYFKNHVLLDVLDLYKKYITEYGSSSAFGKDCVNLCMEIVYTTYELFSCTTTIIVFIDTTADPADDIIALLQFLNDCNLIKLQKVFRM